MDQQKEDADEILFNSMLDTCSRIQDIPRLERTLAKMKERNVLPSVVTYGTVVKAYGKANNVEKVLEVLGRHAWESHYIAALLWSAFDV